MNRKLKLTFIFTHRIRWVAFEWEAKYLDRSKFEIDYLLLNKDDAIIPFLQQMNLPYKVTSYPDYGDTPEVVKFIYDHLIANQTDVVHTHFFAGDLAGLQAAYYAKVPVRVSTRYHPAVQWTRHARSKHELVWTFATNLISLAPCGKASMIAEGVPEDKITVIPQSFDLSEFEGVTPERVAKLRAKYLGNHLGPVIGVAARYEEWKGIQYTIEAYKKVLELHPDALLVLSGTHIDPDKIREEAQNAKKGNTYAPRYADALAICDQLSELPSASYVQIPFEEDLFALFRLFDVFVHVPVDPLRETFGQVYIEAMLSKVPSVITRSGISNEYAIHQENAWVVDYRHSDQIAEGVLRLLNDQSLRAKMIDAAFACAKEYSIERKIHSLETLYQQQFAKATQG